MTTGLAATIRTIQQQRNGRTGLGRRTLLAIAVSSALAAVLFAAVGQWPMAVAALVPALVCAGYGFREGRRA